MTSPWTAQPPYGGPGSFSAKYVAMCFCKRVRFEVNAEPVTSKICDCTICQRLHGAPAQWAALFAKSAVRFSAVSLQHLRWYHVQTDTVCINGAERVLPSKVQCSHCGTWVADEGRNMFMTFPTLFDFGERRGPERYPASFRPRCHIFCGSRSLAFEDGLPNYLDDCRTPLSISDYLLDIAPHLDGHSYKGQSGRIGVLGGSPDFAGAPYYAGMAALRVGAELLYMCTEESATGPIKGYSPELMVSEVYSWSRMSSADPGVVSAEKDRMVAKMEALLPRFHALCIGPGLGRDDRVLDAVARVITAAKARALPLVIDADGLWLSERRPELVQGYANAVLTPNAAEFRRLAKAVLGREDVTVLELCTKMDGPIIVQKGAVDRIGRPKLEKALECAEEGAPRRPGGLGDFLSGSLAVLVGWAALRRRDLLRACEAACVLVRRACKEAFRKQKRAMVAPDVLDEVGAAFEALCPSCPVPIPRHA